MKRELSRKLAHRLTSLHLKEEIRIMEVCGTHTVEFFKTGVKDIFPEGLVLVDGPGCPVCVTPNDFLDRAIAIGREHDAILATFGDMLKVPSSYSSLSSEKASGMDVRIVYSPLDALDMAEKNPDREVVFLSVGFETTAPTEAAAVARAKERGLENFSILAGNKLTPPAVEALLDAKEVKIDGFILPGHVSAVIGSEPWRFVSETYNRPAVVAGFDAEDLLTGLLTLVDLIQKGRPELRNEYSRVVKEQGNEHALKIMEEVFRRDESPWRGIGTIPGSGLFLNSEHAEFDAVTRLPATPPEPKEATGCRCGELLRGLIFPYDCPLYGNACIPEHPVGPCMVSTEGPCSAYYKYHGENK